MLNEKTAEEKEEQWVQIPCLLGRGKGNCTTVNTKNCFSCGFNPAEYDRRRRWINKGRGLEKDENGRKRLNLKGRQR